MESSHIPTQRVVGLITEMRGTPLPVAGAVDRFKAIPVVEDVRPRVDAHRNHATLCVVVRMPKYDDSLMKRRGTPGPVFRRSQWAQHIDEALVLAW